ncbi:MAG TPA: hemerythrin domain-containing protein [Steroidobacteraceae bacterium]
MALLTHSAPERSAGEDAIALLTADHRRVEQLFEEFRSTNSTWREEDLAYDICAALRVHTDVDEAIFYPALAHPSSVLAKAAQREHAAINALIDEIERAGPTENTFFAKVHVLAELFRQHVDAEEGTRGIFTEAAESHLDLQSLGDEIKARKRELLHTFGPLENAALT